ncbi:unnamed protein product [Notodromas monacha]|uniref:Macro domain-containing protein n=1 Tax=Notodromas monacha TaxID=399045 RepID=A0A7R9GC74_9CRUS|nr:unnamed protein product [Notodromas monacha]CAG0917179.1 unnamed protein product [Notodromas monacha]
MPVQMAPKVKEKKGDLFASPKDFALAHCISADVRMGKSIAAIFKAKYGGVSELKAQRKRVGEVAVLTARDNRVIYYLITKSRAWDKPTYDDLTCALKSLKRECVSRGVKKLAMPRIGCGLDNLVWDRVKDIVECVFGDEALTLQQQMKNTKY